MYQPYQKPVQTDWVQIPLRMTPRLSESLIEASRKTNISKSDLVRKALEQYLEFLDTGKIQSLLQFTS
jgi:predicted DNA-binding protein